MLLSQVTILVVVFLYCGSESAERSTIPRSTLLAIVSLTSGAFFASSFAFFSKISPGYGHTFTSSMTAREALRDKFQTSDDPEAKLSLFEYPPSFWDHFRDEIKPYVLENFEEWEIEKPRFWTPRLLSRIPHDMIPVAMRESITQKLSAKLSGKSSGSGISVTVRSIISDRSSG